MSLRLCSAPLLASSSRSKSIHASAKHAVRTMAVSKGDKLQEYAGKTKPLSAADGSTWELGSLAGAGKSVLFVFPKAFTSTCTSTAVGFAEHQSDLAGVTVVGASPDPPEQLQRFKQEKGLPYTLVSDPDHTLLTALGLGETVAAESGEVRFVCTARGDGAAAKHVDGALEALGITPGSSKDGLNPVGNVKGLPTEQQPGQQVKPDVGDAADVKQVE